MTPASLGTWLARQFTESLGKQGQLTLGDFAHLPEHHRYDAALQAAQKWFVHLDRSGSCGILMMADACHLRAKHLEANKDDGAAQYARARFEWYALSQRGLAGTELGKLLPVHFEAWCRTLKALRLRLDV